MRAECTIKATMGAIVAVAALGASAVAATAAPCGHDGRGFQRWIQDFKAEAVAKGVSRGTAARLLDEVGYDTRVIRLDRSQRSFRLSFEEFYRRRVSDALIRRGRRYMETHANLLRRIERQFGVPGAVVMAVWGLETNYGSDSGGKYSIVQSLATLAYDCRRTAFFRPHLLNALVIVDRGDIPGAQMRGGWAGEIGPMQFLPTSYVRYAVDFDGDGRRDLFHSKPDMVASTANFLKGHGWRRGEPWGEGTHNYGVIRDWNKAEVYVRTIAVMAGRLAQAPQAVEPRRRQRRGTRTD